MAKGELLENIVDITLIADVSGVPASILSHIKGIENLTPDALEKAIENAQGRVKPPC